MQNPFFTDIPEKGYSSINNQILIKNKKIRPKPTLSDVGTEQIDWSQGSDLQPVN